MPFIVRNSSATLSFLLQDAYLDLIFGISEHVDLEQVFPEDQLYMSSVSPGALYTAIQTGDIVRRTDADDADIAAANAFDDAIWRWSPSRQQKEALVGQPLSPSSTNKYLTQGVFSLKVKAGGTPRYGYLTFLEGSNVTITDDGAGNFTFASSGVTVYGSPITQAPDSGNVDGTANSAARSDHKHNIPTAIAVSVSSSNAQGSSTTDFSKADHAHQGIHSLKAKATGTARYGDIIFLEGSNITLTDDGVGNFTIAASGTTAYGSPVTQAPDSGNIDGTQNTAARSDHKHNIPTATAVSVTTANAQGASTTNFARADHAHQGIHALAVNSGTARYGDLNLKSGNGVLVSDDGAGNFTFDTTIGPNELYVTAAALNSSLVANYTAGQVMIDGTIYSISAGSTTVGINITNGYIYVNTSGSVTSGSTLPDGAVPLALFTSNGTAITAISNKRVFLNQKNTPGADGDITAVQPDASAAAGSSEKWARANHVHSTSTATPASVGSANAQGSSTTQFPRADHVHQGIHSLKAKATGTARYGDLVLLEGSNVTLTDDGAGNFTIAAAGTSFGSPVTQAPDTGNINGSGSAAYANHQHNIPTATAVSVGTANAQGASTLNFARADHVHQGIHALSVNSGTARYGDQNFKSGNGVIVTDDGAGNFTFDTTIGPNELYVTAAALNSSLVANYTAGQVMINGTIYSISAGSTTVGANITNGYIYVNITGSVASGSTLPDGAVPLALFTSNASAITAISNKRTFLQQANTPGANADISTIQPDASASGGSSERWARANHVHAIVADVAVGVGASNAEGSSTSFSRADHVHAMTGYVKAGVVSGASFAGSPKKAAISFTAFPSTSYAITITGADPRTWTYESKATTGFTINANANAAFTGEVSWTAILSGT